MALVSLMEKHIFHGFDVLGEDTHVLILFMSE
jgi:hypothetical protein